MNDPEARACLLRAANFDETRVALGLIDYFRTTGNRANPSDPSDTGDPNIITQFELENFVWNEVRTAPNEDQWGRMRVLGDQTMQRMNAVLGVTQFLTTAPAPVAAAPEQPRPPAPAPEAIAAAQPWYRSSGTWLAAGGILAAGVSLFFLRRTIRQRNAAQVETTTAQARLREVEARLPETQGRLRELETRIDQARLRLEPARGLDPAATPAPLQGIRNAFDLLEGR